MTDKKVGAVMTCFKCGEELVCQEFIFKGTTKLSWCDAGTTDKHFSYDFNTKKTWCKKTGPDDDGYATHQEQVTQQNLDSIVQQEKQYAKQPLEFTRIPVGILQNITLITEEEIEILRTIQMAVEKKYPEFFKSENFEKIYSNARLRILRDMNNIKESEN